MTNIRNFIKAIGFVLKDGESGVWHKKYPIHGDYEILVKLRDNLKDSKIEWGDKIKTDRQSTSNFSQDETRVVLECVNRLLEKGYKPEILILEKEWKLGHKGKGFLDIQVLDEEGKSFLMIECKTHGKEYDKAKKETEKDGGQLFSYFIQERNTQFICLYASILENSKIKVFSDIVVINKEIRSAENSQEAFEAWKPQIWEKKGIFSKDDKPYQVEFKGIIKKELRPLTKEDGGNIYNKFAEILRKNVISDKTNAFNKIFNLFLCKIVDEFERNENDELRFQWKEGEENEDVLLRLNDLYKRGMELYLDLRIEAVSEEELRKELDLTGNKEKIKQLFIRQKLYSGNEFAFKEIFDKKTFDENCIVVKEVVKLLEEYRIKYSTKQQFLGDFFENLLNTGIKQESGQFFTPIPIAQFICKSIPIKQIIEQKNNKAEPYFLPYLIDYASGSGHFLTEAMEEIDNHIKNIEENWIKCGLKHKKEFLKNKENFDWASEYIYGIEKDYRLAKTTKISTFLNGDGDANVICGDGLDHFKKSVEYKKKLTEIKEERDNKQFDVVIANPPYSVDGFKNTLKHGKEAFELYPYFTDQSSEIECLFVERAKQLLKDGGVAGIILPISILSNGKIHLKAREILLKYFEIKAIIEFGSNTFMATGTKTATVFLRRRANNEWKIIESLVNEFFVNFKDVTVNGIENAFSKYVKYVFEDLELKDYMNLFNDEPSEKIFNHGIFKEYKGHFKKLNGDTLIEAIKETEKEKMLYFILTFDQDFVLVKSPSDSSEEKEFLGYEFSTRRGHEGIKIYKDAKEKNLTKLYNAEFEQLYDKNKVNSYILRAFEGENIPEPSEELKGVLQVQKIHESLDFDRVNFEKKITTTFKKKRNFQTEYKLIKLQELVEKGELQYISGVTFDKKDQVSKETKNRVLTASNIDLETRSLKLDEKLFVDEKKEFAREKALKKNDIFLCTSSGSIKHLGKSTFIKEDLGIYFGGFCGCLRASNETLAKYIFSLLDTPEYRSHVEFYVGQNINNLNQGILDFKIPLPPFDVQEKIVREMEAIEEREKEIENETRVKQREIEKIVEIINNVKTKLENISELIQRGKSPKYGNTNLQIIKSGQARGYKEFDFAKKHYASEEYIVDHRKLQKGDILINSSGVGTAGRVTLFDLDDDCVVDSHITILRLNKDKALPTFILYYLANGIGFKKIESMATGQSGQIELSIDMVKNIQIPLPPLFEQEKIVKQIEQIESKQVELKKEIEELGESKEEVLRKYL